MSAEKHTPPQEMTVMEQYALREGISKLKKIMAVSAIYLSIHSGGAIDQVGDYFTSAEDVVASAVEKPQKITPETVVDGIAFNEYSPAAQREMQSELDQDFEASRESRKRLIDLFGAIDERGPNVAIEAADAYRSEHDEDFVESEVVERTVQGLEDATTNDEVFRSLDTFMQEYGIHAMTLQERNETQDVFDVDVDTTREVARAYVNVFNELPKSFVQKIGLESVTISGPQPHKEGEFGAEGGSYSDNYSSINICATSKVMKPQLSLEGVLVGTAFTYEASIAHEVGHGIAARMGVSTILSENKMLKNDEIGGPTLSQAARNLIDRPKVPSAYSRDSSGEHTAELLSGLLSNRKDGLASVDKWRQFSSESNKSMLEVLDQLEKAHPGIATILVANRLAADGDKPKMN